jgi:2-polyprenyl-3-methyl-5-hydroxy-6-metoxy-1,4-benzoquinol methylase
MQSTVELAILRHDIDAQHFQSVYSKAEEELTKKEKAFITGRKLVLKELEIFLKEIPAGAKVLDVGCGTAHLTKWIQDKGYDVYGLEPSEEMYRYAKANFPDMKIEKGISSELPYPDGYFDFVIAFEVLRYLYRKENIKTYHEINRILKKDGLAFITHVNRYAADFYFFYYQLREVYSKLFRKTHHYCNFTTGSREVKEMLKAGFTSAQYLGTFNAYIRIAYKLSKKLGDYVYQLTAKRYRDQSSFQSIRANFKGHLIVVGKK